MDSISSQFRAATYLQQRMDGNLERWAALHPDKAASEAAIAGAYAEAQERWAHKVHGTVETHEHASRVRQGALARLYEAGTITIHQLSAGASIAHIHQLITRDVQIGTLSLETRVDISRELGAAFFEKLGTVRSEVAYSNWRRQLKQPALVLAIVIDDLSLSGAAKAFRVRKARVRPLLTDALDLWDEMIGRAVDQIDDEDLWAMHARIL